MAGMRRECLRMSGRRIYLFGIILVPLFVTVFFLSLLNEGLPMRIPTAIVDLDHSSMSRSLTRSLDALQLTEISQKCESYDEALKLIRNGSVFGFFVIPDNFEKNTLAGNSPTLEYYSNMTYFVPGSLAFKGFKTVSVAASAGVIQQVLQDVGVGPSQTASIMQPLTLDIFGLGNPWMSYSIYLCPSFAMATLILMIMLMTAFSITIEIKNYTSQEWLRKADGSIIVAVVSKLFPQTVMFTAVGFFIQWLLFGYSHFPMHGSIGWMLPLWRHRVSLCFSPRSSPTRGCR